MIATLQRGGGAAALRSMHDKPTSFDIAFLAGVSQPTVSRALRGSPVVSLETRKRIEEIARQLNYRVDKNASNLRSQHSNTLALLLFEDPTPDDSQINPFFLSMLGSITRASARQGYDLLISFQQLSERLAAGLRGQPQGRRHHPARLRRLRGIPAAARATGRTGHAFRALGTGAQRRAGRFGRLGQCAGRLRRHAPPAGAGPQPHRVPRPRDHSLPGILRPLPRLRARADGSARVHVLAPLQVDAINTEESGFQAATELRARGVEFDAIVAGQRPHRHRRAARAAGSRRRRAARSGGRRASTIFPPPASPIRR